MIEKRSKPGYRMFYAARVKLSISSRSSRPSRARIFGLPGLAPRATAAAIPDFVLSRISARSNSANAPSIFLHHEHALRASGVERVGERAEMRAFRAQPLRQLEQMRERSR